MGSTISDKAIDSSESAAAALRYEFVPTAHSFVMRIETAHGHDGRPRDILLLPGYPGRQHMESMGCELARLGFTVHLPVHPGTSHEFNGIRNEIVSETSYFLMRDDIEAYVRDAMANWRGQVILGSFSAGSCMLPPIIERYSDRLDGLVILSGIFSGNEYFGGQDYYYTGLTGWEAAEAYFNDCAIKQVNEGNVPIKGPVERALREFRALVETPPDLAEVDLDTDIPALVVHSPVDKVIPPKYVHNYSWPHAKVFTPEMDHAMRSLPGGTTDPQVEIAREIDRYFETAPRRRPSAHS